MACLEHLATELILNTLHRIPPEDLESASLVSKPVHRAVQPLRDEHRKVLEEQYRVWDLHILKKKDPSHEYTDIHKDLLCTVSADQRLASMVQTLRVDFEVWLDQRLSRGSWRPHETFPGALPGLRRSRRQVSE